MTPQIKAPYVVTAATRDAGKVRLGGGYRLPTKPAADVTDKGTIRLGGGYRLPTAKA